MHALIVGCGYLGRRVADRWLANGHRVTALTRSPKRAGEFQSHGITPVVGDVLSPEPLTTLPAIDVLLYAVGYDRTTTTDKRTVSVNGLAKTLDALAGNVGRIVFISSSSVYGQDQGEWIDETSPTIPQTENGRICLEAEQTLVASPAIPKNQTTILRLSGIYGPGRLLARVDSLRQSTPLAGRPESWLNLIHVDDAATAVVATAGHSHPPPLLLVSDDRPLTRGEYYTRLAHLAAAPPPTFDATQTPRHGQGLNKRCRNSRVKESMGIDWQFPTAFEGLPASLGGIS